MVNSMLIHYIEQLNFNHCFKGVFKMVLKSDIIIAFVEIIENVATELMI